MKIEERPDGKWMLLSDDNKILLMVSSKAAALRYAQQINKQSEQRK